MMTHDKEIEQCKENHCALRVRRVDKTAAHTVLYLWCRQSLRSWMSQTICQTVFKRAETIEERSRVVQLVTRSHQCSNCNKNIKITDGLKRCSDGKIAFHCSRKCQKEQWPRHKDLYGTLKKMAEEKQRRIQSRVDQAEFVSHLTPKQMAKIASLVG